jgi:hypothetical protein
MNPEPYEFRTASTASHPDELDTSFMVISGARLERLLVPTNTVN